MVLVTWSVVLGLVTLGVLLAATVFWLKKSKRRSFEGDAGNQMVAEMEKRVVSRFPSPTEDEAMALVKEALAIRDPGKVAESFRMGSASPEQVVDFLNGLEKMDGPMKGMTWLSSMDANGLLIDGVAVNAGAGYRAQSRLALLTPDGKGRWKIDFDSFARTVKPSWSELLQNRATEGLIRVVVKDDHYFNGPFGDDSKWVCYGMASPDTEVAMLGYCRTGSPQEAAMERIIKDGLALPGAVPAPRRGTLRVRRVEGSEPRQFEIVQVVAEDWVVSVKPFDEDFQ